MGTASGVGIGSDAFMRVAADSSTPDNAHRDKCCAQAAPCSRDPEVVPDKRNIRSTRIGPS